MNGGVFVFYDEYCKLCNKVGKSPSAVAMEMGFQKSSLSRWKHGMIPRRANLLKIAAYFDVDVSLFEEKEKPADDGGLSEIQQRLVMLIPALDDDTCSTLLILAKQLIGRAQSPGDS